MSRHPKNPLRPLLETERQYLRQISRSQVAPAIQVARAKALLSVAAGSGYTKAAQKAGRRSGDAIAALVTRFNGEGIAAVVPRHGGGQQEGERRGLAVWCEDEAGPGPTRQFHSRATAGSPPDCLNVIRISTSAVVRPSS